MKYKKIAGIFLACFMLLGIQGYSQPGLNKLKEKAKEKTEKAKDKATDTKDVKGDAVKTDGGNAGTKKEEGKKEEGTASKSKAPDPETSPAVINIRKFRNSRSFMESAIKKNYETERNLTDMRKTLDQLKQQDPNWVEIPQFEAEYAEYKRQVDELKAIDETKRGIEDVAMALRSVNGDIWKFIDYGDDWLSKAKVEQLKKKSEGKDIGDYQKGVLADADKFFAEKSAEVKSKALESVKKDGNSSFLKVNRDKPDFIPNFSATPAPSYYAEQLNPAIKIMKAALGIVPGDAELQARLKDLEDQKAEILAYEKSDEFKKDIEKKEAYDIENRRIAKALTVDASLDGVIRRDWDKSHGAILRISIVDRDWKISKNGVDIPTYKSKNVEIAVKETDGKCYKMYGTIGCTYMGGGTYGAPKFSTDSGSQFEMNCANVNK